MSSNGRVLDENVGHLLRRSYVPALARPDFRAVLESTFLREVRRLRDADRSPRPIVPLRRRLPWVAAAAAVLALLLFGRDFLGGGEPQPSVAELLAGGRVAVRLGTEGWRAASEEELARGLTLDGPVALELPSASELALVVADGRVLAHGPAGAELAAGPGLAVRLEHGALTLERSPGGPAAWSVKVPPVDVSLAHGLLKVHRAGDLLRLELREGAATLDGPLGRRDLVAGLALELIDGVPAASRAADGGGGAAGPVVLAPHATGGADGGGREAIPAPSDAQPELETGAPAVSGLVLDPEGAPVESFRLALLYERLGSEFERALTRDFTAEDGGAGGFHWEGLRPGRCVLFAHAPGLALAEVGPLDLGGGPVRLEEPVRLEVGGSLAGVVVDPRSGTPVSDAVVVSENDTPQHFLLLNHPTEIWSPATTRASADGSFRLDHLRPGPHRLRVTAPGFGAAFLEPILVVENEVRANVTVELHAGGSVAGFVSRPDGTPWAGAQLLCTMMEQTPHAQMNFATARTGPDGRYRMDDLPLLPMLVVLVDPGSQNRPRVKPVEVRANETQTVDFETTQPSTRLRGTLRDADGVPVPHQNLALFDRRTLAEGSEDFEATSSLSDGSFAFDHVLPGHYLVFAVETQGRWIRYVDEVVVHDVDEVVHDLAFSGYSIRAAVTDGLTGEPVARASFQLDTVARDGERIFAGWGTLVDGRLSIEDLGEGEYGLTVYPETGELGQERRERILLNAETPTSELVYALAPGGSVSVIVVEGNGDPVELATVVLVDEREEAHSFGRSSTTGEGGRFLARGVAVGSYLAVAAKDGRRSEPVPVECRAGETTVVRLELSSAPATMESER